MKGGITGQLQEAKLRSSSSWTRVDGRLVRVSDQRDMDS